MVHKRGQTSRADAILRASTRGAIPILAEPRPAAVPRTRHPRRARLDTHSKDRGRRTRHIHPSEILASRDRSSVSWGLPPGETEAHRRAAKHYPHMPCRGLEVREITLDAQREGKPAGTNCRVEASNYPVVRSRALGARAGVASRG